MSRNNSILPTRSRSILMPSTRRQMANVRRSREMDMISEFENMDVLLGNETTNPLERESANTSNGSIGNNDLESDLHFRIIASEGNKIRNFGRVGEPLRQDRSLESMQTFSNEMNNRLSHELDAMMSMMHSQTNRAISSTISERVISEFQNFMSSISSGNRDTESGSLSNNQENNKRTNGLKTS